MERVILYFIGADHYNLIVFPLQLKFIDMPQPYPLWFSEALYKMDALW